MTTTPPRALVLGNSDGIGRAFTDRLLANGWLVSGLSRSGLNRGGDYHHEVCDVTGADFVNRLEGLAAERGPFDLVTHCVGVGYGVHECGFAREVETFEANLMSLVKLVATLIPGMIERKSGHLIGLSSIADDGHIADAPAYSATKAGYSNYLKSLGLYLRSRGVAVTNVRFGFVDTKMAQADSKPMIISPERAADVMMRTVRRRPLQVTVPKAAGAAMRGMRWLQNLRIWTARAR